MTFGDYGNDNDVDDNSDDEVDGDKNDDEDDYDDDHDDNDFDNLMMMYLLWNLANIMRMIYTARKVLDKSNIASRMTGQ